MKYKKPIRRRSAAGRLLLGGHALILLALCDFTARLVGRSAEHLLYAEHFLSSLSAAFVLVWGAALGVDYLESRSHRE